MRIALFGWTIGPIFYDSMHRLVEILHLHQAEILVYAPFLEFLQQEAGIDPGEIQIFYSDKELVEVDFFLSIGGDGTFLEAITFVRDSGIPMVGINSGRLGFLADIAQAELEFSIEQLFAGKFILKNLKQSKNSFKREL